MIAPAFENRNAIVFAADNIYCPYLAVTIKSLIDNANISSQYDIIILSSGISEKKQQQISQMQRQNISIRFFDMEQYMRNIDLSKFYVSGHITISSYFRLFMPDILQNYLKAAYLDCDIIILDDIEQILNYDLEDKVIGVVHDIDNFVYSDDRKKYMRDKLNMDYKNYFNAGILVMDIVKARSLKLMDKCFALLDHLQNPMFHDQTLLNGVCYNNVKFLDMRWNYQTHFNYFHQKEELKSDCPASFMDDYHKTKSTAKILHYTARPKPWENPSLELAGKWWEYARRTDFYEEIIFNNIKMNYSLLSDFYHYPTYRWKYLWYKTVEPLTFGKFKSEVKQKRRNLKSKIKNIRQLLKSSPSAA